MTISWPLSRLQVLDASGRPLLVPSVQFFAAGTTTPLDVYKDAAMSVAYAQPIVADGYGRFPRVFLPTALYAEKVFGPYGDLLWFDDGLGYVPAASSGGSGGGSVDPTAVAQTGDVKWRLDPGILPGWVRMNARTIGSATSGATELADASARALYVYLWQSFPDTIAPVTSGRGTTAAADFSAGKPITIPSMQGLVAAGLDDMGSTAANRLQVSTDLTLTAGSATATVASASRIATGMVIQAAGVPASTVVSAVSGTTVTMSNAAGAGSTGTVPARFSIFVDAQTPGLTGADCVEALSNANLPAALPAGTGTYDAPAFGATTYGSLASIRYGDGGTATTVTGIWKDLAPNVYDPPPTAIAVSIPNPGGGVPVSTVQPSRLGTFYMKI